MRMFLLVQGVYLADSEILDLIALRSHPTLFGWIFCIGRCTCICLFHALILVLSSWDNTGLFHFFLILVLFCYYVGIISMARRIYVLSFCLLRLVFKYAPSWFLYCFFFLSFLLCKRDDYQSSSRRITFIILIDFLLPSFFFSFFVSIFSLTPNTIQVRHRFQEFILWLWKTALFFFLLLFLFLFLPPFLVVFSAVRRRLARGSQTLPYIFAFA